jgi:hypothetical protein
MTTSISTSSNNYTPIESIQELVSRAYIPYDLLSARPLTEVGSEIDQQTQAEKDRKIGYCVFCDKYLSASQILVIDCYCENDTKKGQIDKRSIAMCERCLRDYYNQRRMTKLITVDKHDIIEDLIYNTVVTYFEHTLLNTSSDKEDEDIEDKDDIYKVIKDLFTKDKGVREFFNGDYLAINASCKKLFPIRFELRQRYEQMKDIETNP